MFNKFISIKNLYSFDEISWKDCLIYLYNERHERLVFKYEGDVEFFKDGNGVGESWDDFSHDITTWVVHELSDENITLLNFHEEYVVEWIAEQIYLDKEKGDERL